MEPLKPEILSGSAITQFKDGWKGGPGRPPKKPMTEALKKIAAIKKLHKNPFTGRIEEMTLAEIAACGLIKKAQNGNVLAFMEIADRIEGKAAQKVEVEERKTIVAKIVAVPGVNMNLPPNYEQRRIDE